MFTTKKILGYVTASFLMVSAVAGPAQAQLQMNGVKHNQLQINGVKHNQLAMNGVKHNQLAINGVKHNQLAINGAKFNRAYGAQKNGIADTDRETRGFNFNAITPRSVILNVPQRPEAK